MGAEPIQELFEKYLRPPILDLGCGSNKWPRAFGVDIFPADGVDLVWDLDKAPWPIKDESYDSIVCRHVLEHVKDSVTLMKEIHRVSRPDGLALVTTPHFSCVDSWGDPTHIRHLGVNWHAQFLRGGYLALQTGMFELVERGVTFAASLRGHVARLACRCLGLERWESYGAFFPGKGIWHVLRIVK